ncbi:MAG: hypothetical protein JW812_00755 [Alphaproteobacteria bacterium]|nr:hypothetical protein [Alphaproteobacteria bacterium]MBN2780299.1 hypothetical protein [Alphaproteobacteria bacterium]
MIQKHFVFLGYVSVFFFLIGLFFVQFSIREKKDALNRLHQKIEKAHDEKQSLKVLYGELSSQNNLQALEKTLFGDRVGLAGQK